MLKDDSSHPYYVKSDQPDPTLYVSFLPQFAEEFKSKKKGIVFIASNFLVGLFGDASQVNMKELETAVNGMSSKPAKVVAKTTVSFKFKEKGKKPIEAKDVLQFMITGADMNVDKLAELFSVQSFRVLE